MIVFFFFLKNVKMCTHTSRRRFHSSISPVWTTSLCLVRLHGAVLGRNACLADLSVGGGVEGRRAP